MYLMKMFCDTHYQPQINSLTNLMAIRKNKASGLIASANVTFTGSRRSGESIIQKMK